MKQSSYSLFIIFYLSAFTVFAQAQSAYTPALAEASPESVGMSSERLSRIDTMARELVDSGELPGMVALVAREGKIVYLKSFGAATAQGEPLRTDHIFRIASQTKAITSTAVMMLWEEAKFRLDDPIAQYIRDFAKPRLLDTYDEETGEYTTRAATGEITIRHLLTHSSGIGYGVISKDPRFKRIYEDAGIIDLVSTGNITIEENVKRLASLPLRHNPGEAWTYSLGLDVLGYFVEIVSGMKFDEFLRTRLFEPLGMHDTWFYLPDDKTGRLVDVLHKVDGAWKAYPVTWYDPDYPKKGARTYFSGGAGLSSTARDYAAFLQMYLNGGELNGVRILSRTTIDVIMANQLADPGLFGEDNTDQGLAFAVVTAKGQAMGGAGSEGTFRWGGYFNTRYWADPRENVIGILLKQTQKVESDPSDWMFRQLVGAAITGD